MPVTIEQWIKHKTAAAVRAGVGEWVDCPATAFGKPIYRLTDGPVTFVLSELGFMYDGPPASFECRYDGVEQLEVPPLREIMPRGGDLLPRNAGSRLLTSNVLRRDGSQRLQMQFSLIASNLVASVLPRIVGELA